jgi:class 3 adenylate cyclase
MSMRAAPTPTRGDRGREAVSEAALAALPQCATDPQGDRSSGYGARADPARRPGPTIDLRTPPDDRRSLATILFTDVVGSTDLAVRLGDVAFVQLLASHDALAARNVSIYSGRTVHLTGDGVVAVFGLPSAAMRCAAAFRSAASDLGVPVRCGVHAGEIHDRGGDITGVHVNIAARVCARAASGEVLVSDVARQLAFGSGLTFERRRRVKLRGLPGSWMLSSLAT